MREFLKQNFAVPAAILCLLIMTHATVGAAVKPATSYKDGRMTIEAKQMSLAQVLEMISKTAGVDVFTAKGFDPFRAGSVSVQAKDEPLEDVLKSVLRGLNYAVIYTKEGDDFRVAAVRIYPEGQTGGEIVPLFSGGRAPVYEEKNRRGETVTVLVNTTGQIVTRGNLTERRGAIGPAQTEVAPQAQASLQEPWIAMQVQLEQQEAERFSELLMLRRQAEAATDQQKKQALALVYADEVAKFEAFKRANMNKIESLKRMNQFQEVTGR